MPLKLLKLAASKHREIIGAQQASQPLAPPAIVDLGETNPPLLAAESTSGETGGESGSLDGESSTSGVVNDARVESELEAGSDVEREAPPKEPETHSTVIVVPDPGALSEEKVARKRKRKRKPEPEPEPTPPPTASELVMQAKAASKAGHKDAAKALYKRALNLEMKNIDALTALVELSMASAKHSDVIKYGSRALRLVPNSVPLRLHLGDAYAATGQIQKAKVQYLRAKQLGSDKAAARLAKIGG